MAQSATAVAGRPWLYCADAPMDVQASEADADCQVGISDGTASVMPRLHFLAMTTGMEHVRTATKGRSTVLIVVASAVALSTLGWWTWTSSQLNKVDVAWNGRPVCTGTTVRDEEEAGRPVAVVAARPGMHCVVELQVTNYGRHTVAVDKVVGPWLGPGAGTVVKAAPADGVEPRASRDDHRSVDYLVGTSLHPGRTMILKVAFVFRESGCMDDGVFGAKDWPSLQVSVFGRTAVRTAAETLTVRTYRKFSHCTD